MKTACFIPIKANSERVPGKNFRVLNGRKLYEYIISHAMEACCFDAIYIDTNSPEITEYALDHGLQVIERLEALAQNTANGNDLLVYHQQLHPEYDYYFQLFATAPYLQPDSIKGCVNALVDSETYDSCFTALKNHGVLLAGYPSGELPPGHPAQEPGYAAIIEETTGLYGISKNSLQRYRCRIGRKPCIFFVDKFEAIDINTEEDLVMAEYVGRDPLAL